MPNTTEFETALATWLAAAQQVITDHDARYDFDFGTNLVLERNRKYIRVVRADRSSSRSAHCFIDKTDGNVYKPASWKGPIKNFPRGNIFTTRIGVGPYGADTY